MLIMRAIISIFSLIMFLGLQGTVHACPSDCSHHQAKNTSDHNCCDSVKTPEDKKKSHNCAYNYCFKSAHSETSGLIVESRVSNEELDISNGVISPSFHNADRSGKHQQLGYSDTRQLPTKIPLYIAYQKLLLP